MRNTGEQGKEESSGQYPWLPHSATCTPAPCIGIHHEAIEDTHGLFLLLLNHHYFLITIKPPWLCACLEFFLLCHLCGSGFNRILARPVTPAIK